MKKGFLSQYFEGVSAKRLSAVEASPDRSNQHEFNGVKALRSYWGKGGSQIVQLVLFGWVRKTKDCRRMPLLHGMTHGKVILLEANTDFTFVAIRLWSWRMRGISFLLQNGPAEN